MNAYEPLPLPAPATPRVLRLLCVLVRSRDGSTRALPVHTLHRVPPCVAVQGRWSLEGDDCLHLRETHATAPTARVLERCLSSLNVGASGRVSVLGVIA